MAKKNKTVNREAAIELTKEDEQFEDMIDNEIEKERASKAYARMGREAARARQGDYTSLGGPIGTPAAYIKRGADYVSDKLTDLDAYLSEKAGMTQRANMNKSYREGMKNTGSFNKKGGAIKAKKMASGGSVSSASKRADGIAIKGKTKGRMVQCT